MTRQRFAAVVSFWVTRVNWVVFDKRIACFVCFTQKFSIVRGSDISIVRLHYRNFIFPPIFKSVKSSGVREGKGPDLGPSKL